MSKWGSFDYKSFEKFQKNFEDRIKTESLNQFIVQVLRELGNRTLAKVKPRTPVGQYGDKLVEFTTKDGKEVSFIAKGNGRSGGQLRRGWKITDVKRRGSIFEITIFNNVEYASFVENGHRTRGGGGQGWVEGQFMLRISLEEIQQIMPALLGKRYNEFLEKLMGG
ncbi:HK97 gp10 family phage protein [Bacillaceae bacterium Marseille-Q3522]|nr:HK97 gp10 family phage protein [Bacillaceae bacterium Marseille-Q3522]